VPHGILRVFNTILYKNEFQTPKLFPTQVSLSPEHSTLALIVFEQYHITIVFSMQLWVALKKY
jgi:hypothetical protein